MQRETQSDVLVVGAGPVGMLVALLLSQGGTRVRIIDQESRTASRTYACALHPGTLDLLERIGLAKEVLKLGRKVNAVAFYEGTKRRAEVQFAQLPGAFPYVVVVEQSAFESLLENQLRSAGQVRVEWNHQLSQLRSERDQLMATVDTLAVSAKGYAVPEMEWSVEKTTDVHASYLIGADGPNSIVRKSLGIASDVVGQSEFFAVYEFESNLDFGDELRIVLDSKGTTSVLWPLPDGRFRWSFQLLQEHLAEFPSKERRSLLIGDPELERANRQFIEKLIRERAPWFSGSVQQLGWSTDVEFEHRVAKRFGQQRCWLCGDAAHQTGPAGMQSMNLGLAEAEQLASALHDVLRRQASETALEAYNTKGQTEWRELLGLSGSLKGKPHADPWVAQRAKQIVPCIPASGSALKNLLGQLGLEFA